MDGIGFGEIGKFFRVVLFFILFISYLHLFVFVVR